MLTIPQAEVCYGDRFRIGPHLFQCGDITAPGEWESLVRAWQRLGRSPVGWIYSDPPWSAVISATGETWPAARLRRKILDGFSAASPVASRGSSRARSCRAIDP